MKHPMRPSLRTLAACCLVAIGHTAWAAGTVDVSFVQPERFTDADRGLDLARNLERLDKYLVSLGQRDLADGDTLTLDVLDVDLAGDTDPFLAGSSGRDLRVLKGGADWPRIQVRYTLQHNGTTVRSGEERVSDMNYLDNTPARGVQANDPLRYEKHMLDEWFQARFGAPKVVSR